jgi:hypothetical protein
MFQTLLSESNLIDPLNFLFFTCICLPTSHRLSIRPCSFMFGGAGKLNGGIRPILSEFWQYIPTTGVWALLTSVPVVNSLAAPVGRCVHSILYSLSVVRLDCLKKSPRSCVVLAENAHASCSATFSPLFLSACCICG